MTSRLAIVAAATLCLVAGCLGGPRPTANPATDVPDVTPGPDPSTVPSIIKVDDSVPKKGVIHNHDHWGGSTSRVILDREVPVGRAGVCVGNSQGGCRTGTRESTEIQFESSGERGTLPNNVWPGTGSMTVDIDLDGRVLVAYEVHVAAPNRAPQVFLVDSSKKTLTITDIQENQTDPPHGLDSAWSFRIAASNAAVVKTTLYEGTMKWKVTILRSDRPLPIDPAHPDRWGTDLARTLLDQTTEDKVQNVNGLYDHNANTFRPPENSTVLPLTGMLVVDLSWVNDVAHQPKLRLAYCTPGRSCTDTSSFTFPKPTSEGATSRTYAFSIGGDAWDSPYATKSEWVFTWRFDDGPLGDDVAGTGVFDGSVHVRGLILKHPDVDPA